MTSEARECFVYLTLPGATEAVTAGRFVVETRRDVPTGRFVYGRRYLALPDAVEIDPVDLRLGTATYETVLHKGLFGALRDGGPDHWGRRIVERHLGGTPSELEFLLHSPDDRAGSLGFGLNPTPPAPVRTFNRTIDLERLQETADALLKGEAPVGPDALQVDALLALGTSMGGARPKAVVEDEDSLWLAKFNRPDDPWNHAKVEHTMLLLGRAAGLTTAHSRLVTVGDRDVLLVKRFDREKVEAGYTRARMVSGLTVLRTDENDRSRWSYVVLAEEIRRIAEVPNRDAPELFRRMVFNALISNTDDHPRNHALIAPGRGWHLSPAYDLTPSTPVSLDHRDLAMEVGDQGRWANAKNLASQSPRFLVPQPEAETIVDTMEAIVRGQWFETARKVGVTEAECGAISPAFAYPGFRL